MDKPVTLKITQIKQENENTRTFYFEHKLGSLPGQFVMLWIPGVDQKPFSISFDDGKNFGLTIFKRGPLTEKLFEKQVGDKVGISGPYGTGFSVLPNRHYIMVAGGYGAAPLKNLCELVSAKGSSIDFCVGARTKNSVLFERELSAIPNLKLHIATDDGSLGTKGFVTDFLGVILPRLEAGKNPPANERDPSATSVEAQDDKKPALVVTCGPEVMEKKVLDLCNQYKVDCEISLERHMKCGLGVCGQCCVDDLGIPSCTKGPVVNRITANQIVEFGQYHRDKSGAKCY